LCKTTLIDGFALPWNRENQSVFALDDLAIIFVSNKFSANNSYLDSFISFRPFRNTIAGWKL
jgi:hypothetical protein